MTLASILHAVPSLRTTAVARSVQGVTVVATVPDTVLHTLNEVGGRILALADGTRSVAQIAEAISREYEVEADRAEADVAAYVTLLEGKGVLELRTAP